MTHTRRMVVLRRGWVAGHTLIELLVAAAILSLSLGAIVACMDAGLRAWESARGFQRDRLDGILVAAILGQDLSSTYPLFVVPFRGDAAGLTCAGYGLRADAANVPARISWRAETREGRSQLIRERTSCAVMADGGAPVRETLPGIFDGVTFAYAASAGAEAIEWRPEWTDPTNLPHAVQVRLAVNDGTQAYTIERVYPVPNRTYPRTPRGGEGQP